MARISTKRGYRSLSFGKTDLIALRNCTVSFLLRAIPKDSLKILSDLGLSKNRNVRETEAFFGRGD